MTNLGPMGLPGLLLAVMTSTEPSTLMSIYRSARRYDKSAFKYAPPSERRRRAVEGLARALLDTPNKSSEALRAQARASGLELVSARDDAGPVLVLREAEARREGDGLYAFRPGGAPVCIQAPHTFFDEGTGEVALAVFAGMRAACLAVNTVDRRTPSASGARGEADMAHAPFTVFQTITRAVVWGPRWPIVQVHGFGAQDDLPPGTAAVISDGADERPGGAPAARLREALRRRVGAPVLLYGEDTHVLGATSNVQAAEARRAGVPFLHVELAAEVRRALRASRGEILAAALREILSPPGREGSP